ncbi:hypothetical protein CRYUN_Cryun09bG0061900 [Craigia yunnanensis]
MIEHILGVWATREIKDEDILDVLLSFAPASRLRAEFGPVLATRWVYAARIPEHTCQKVIETNTCELQKCIQECCKEPAGMGDCRDNNCYCTYYCKDPPM